MPDEHHEAALLVGPEPVDEADDAEEGGHAEQEECFDAHDGLPMPCRPVSAPTAGVRAGQVTVPVAVGAGAGRGSMVQGVGVVVVPHRPLGADRGQLLEVVVRRAATWRTTPGCARPTGCHRRGRACATTPTG